MSVNARLLVLFVAMLSLAACGRGHEDKVEEHVWQGQVNALEKAKGVEDMVKDAAEQQRQQVEEDVAKMKGQ